MKKKIIAILLVMLIFVIGNVFANDLEGSIKDFVNTASNNGNGTSYLAVQYDITKKMLSGVAQFGIVGPWGVELGMSFGDHCSFDIDILSFVWPIYFSNNVFLTLGFGAPVNMIYTADKMFGISPHAKIEFNFVGKKGLGAVIYARPGYKLGPTVNGFSIPVGVGFKLPGEVLANMF